MVRCAVNEHWCVKLRVLLVLLPLLLFLTPAPASSSPINVAVSIAPQRFVVKGIGKDLVSVMVLVPPGAEPHSYEPTPRQMKLLSRATIYFTVGVEMEKSWLHRFKSVNPGLEVVDMDAGVKRIPLPRGGYDPHVWLSTWNIRVLASNALKALVRVDGAHAREFRRNYRAFLERVDEVERSLKQMLGNCRLRTFVAFHPAWSYFARQFGFTQLSIQVEGREPTPLEMVSLVRRAKRDGAKVVLVEPQFSSRTAQVVAGEVGARVVRMDPLSDDWEGMMLRLGRVLKEQCR